MRHVYFARVVGTEGPIKIGCSSCPAARCRQLGFDVAAEVELIASMPGDYLLERNLHLKFAEFRAPGPERLDRTSPIPGAKEWFHASPILTQFIKNAKARGRITLRTEEQREWVFARRYLAGETLEAIASDFGITRERVRQILRSIGVPSRGTLPEHRRPKRYREAYRQRCAA